ncbi:MAG: radical SAM protein [Rhodomicrobium sp.]
MATVGLPPLNSVPTNSGKLLTFIVPAPRGCNLKCPFCFLKRQGQHISQTNISPPDLETFIEEAHQEVQVFAVSVQGIEPLLPDSLDYTKSILSISRELSLPANIVTNGTLLRDAMPFLANFAINTLGVSLDSATPDEHDRLRGVKGAWAASVEGIKSARRSLKSTALAVLSVLLPSKVELIKDMPALVRELGVDYWIVQPLIPFGKVVRRNALFRDLTLLTEVAGDAGIRLLVSGEQAYGLDNCLYEKSKGKLPLLSLPQDVQVVRLSPDGQCLLGSDILAVPSPAYPRWRPGERHAGSFLKDLENKRARHSLSSGFLAPSIGAA